MSKQSIDADAFNAFEAAGWETRAGDYDGSFRALTSRLADPLLDAVDTAAGTRVLDVASGPGYVAGRAAERGAVPIGVDIAEAMVTLARRLYPHVRFLQSDAQSLPFAERSFDAVVANLAILHLGRPERAVGEFVRVLVPGGKLALTVWDKPERMRLVGVLLEAVRDAEATTATDIPAGPDFFRFADDDQFTALLQEQGIQDVGITRLAFTHPIVSTDELWDGLLRGTVRMSSHVLGQPEEIRRRIRSGFDRRLRSYRRSGGGYALPVSVKLAVGRKAA